MGLLEKYHIAGDAESLELAATSHREMAALIRTAAQDVEATPLESWTGAAAQAATAKRRKLSEAMTQTADAMTKIADGHDALAKDIRSTRVKIEGLVAGVVAATVVGVLLTWATAGLLASATVAVDSFAITAIVAAIAGLETSTVAAIGTWVAFNSVIGIIEGITFTGVDHEVEDTPWTPDDAAQVFTIAAGNLVGRGASAGIGRLAAAGFGKPVSLGAKIGQGALSGSIGAATAGTANPIVVPLARGDKIDWKLVGTSAATNLVVGGIGGAFVGGAQIKAVPGRYNNLSNSIKAITGRDFPGSMPPVPVANPGSELVPVVGTPGGAEAGGQPAIPAGNGSEAGESVLSYQGDPDAESLYFTADEDGDGTLYSSDSDGSDSDGSYTTTPEYPEGYPYWQAGSSSEWGAVAGDNPTELVQPVETA